MPLKVSFELADRDLRYFRKRMREAIVGARSRDEAVILEAARHLLEQTREEEVPEFVRQRIGKLEMLIGMVEDEDWKLAGADRQNVVSALAYFAEPDDLIPDTIPGLGFLDDAIMVELVVIELKHEIDAYNDFRHFRKAEEKRRGRLDPMTRDEFLSGRRKQLHARMRRRRSGRRRSGGGGASFSLW